MAPKKERKTTKKAAKMEEPTIFENVVSAVKDAVTEVAPVIVEEVAPAIVEEVAPVIVEEVAPVIVEEVAPAIVEEDVLEPIIVEATVADIQPEQLPEEIEKPTTLFVTSILSKTVSMPITEVGKNLKEVLRNKVAELVEAKCIVEGYVKQHSVQILSFSCGLVHANNAMFNVSYSCEVFLPCAGMVLEQCVITEILESAGIELKSNQSPNIFVVYVYQDHNFDDKEFKGRVGDTAAVHVMDYRFEIYDEHITIMGEIV